MQIVVRLKGQNLGEFTKEKYLKLASRRQINDADFCEGNPSGTRAYG